MSKAIRHSSAFKPITVAERAVIDHDNWDRVQNFSVSVNQPQENLYEIGRLDKMVTEKDKLEVSVSITQFEYGTLDSYLQLAGLTSAPAGGVKLNHFDSGRVDFINPGKTEFNGDLEQTLWCERLSLESLGLEISADERLTRTFELSGNFCKIARGANKCVIFKTFDAVSGTSGAYDLDVDDPAPVVNPNRADEYILKIIRIRDGVVTELTETADFTYDNGTKKIAVIDAEEDDHFRVWYTAATYGTAGDPQALNDDDDYFLGSESVTVLVDDGTHAPLELDKLTSLSISATLNRIAEGAIGSNEDVFNDVESYDTSVSLDGYVKNYPIQEALMSQTGENWGIIDYSRMNPVKILVKVFDSADKAEFKIGYKMENCEISDDSPADYAANEFGSATVTLNSDNLTISTEEADIA
jgi:hypothetical protein